MRTCLDFVLAACGNAELMTKTLKHTLCDHAAGNYRVLATLAAELLNAATTGAASSPVGSNQAACFPYRSTDAAMRQGIPQQFCA